MLRRRIRWAVDRARFPFRRRILGGGWSAYQRVAIGRAGGEAEEPLVSGPRQQAFPPRRLRAMTVNPSDPEFFIWSGHTQFELIRSMLAGTGVDAAGLEDVLDFGCGCGRIARWWADVEGPKLHGCDTNPELLAWCERNLAIEGELTRLEPPLPYEDGSFDLVYALSVFTHLPAELERRWVAELTRVLSSDGFLWFTVAGEAHLDQLSPRQRQAFARGERVTQFADIPGTNLCAAFHPAPYVERGMLGELRLVGSELGSADGAAPTYSQDAYLARKPAVAQAS